MCEIDKNSPDASKKKKERERAKKSGSEVFAETQHFSFGLRQFFEYPQILYGEK